ncbi:MAG: hypothetical protein ACE5PT_09760 [Gemmatimonadales bacterium]
MNTPPNDADLRGRFQALRQEDTARAAPFTAPRPRPSRAGGVRVWAAAAAAAAVLAAVLWALDRGGGGDRLAIDLSATAWQAPTDFLLETPGRDLLRTVPRVGTATQENRREGRNGS